MAGSQLTLILQVQDEGVESVTEGQPADPTPQALHVPHPRNDTARKHICTRSRSGPVRPGDRCGWCGRRSSKAGRVALGVLEAASLGVVGWLFALAAW